jgi:metallo-beta-lactamase family protein
MSSGGRIMNHEAMYLPHENNTLLLTGYQAVGTLGRLLEEGAREVEIDGVTVPVKARVEMINGFSGHKDSEHLLELVATAGEPLKKVFVVMGEPKSSLFLIQRIRDYLGVEAISPEEGKVYKIF